MRILFSLIVGNACLYVMRQTFTFLKASPKCPFSLETVGWAFTAYSLAYGFSKFAAGAVCDRYGARWLLPFGLGLTALLNVLTGFSSTAYLFGLLYACTSVPQAIGGAACMRILPQWFPSKKLGTAWGFFVISPYIGVISVFTFGAWILEHCEWRFLFFITGILCLSASLWLPRHLQDRPEDIGLSPSESSTQASDTEDTNPQPTLRELLVRHIFCNPRLLMICGANFFVYFVLSGLRCWIPVMFVSTQTCTVTEAGFKMTIMEIGGFLSALTCGAFTDKYMPEKRTLFGAVTLLLTGILIGILNGYGFDGSSTVGRYTDFLMWPLIGFFLAGAQTMTSLSAVKFGSKQVAASAVGFIGIAGYLGAAASGIGLASLLETHGWHAVLSTLTVGSMLGGLFFLLTLRKPKTTRTV